MTIFESVLGGILAVVLCAYCAIELYKIICKRHEGVLDYKRLYKKECENSKFWEAQCNSWQELCIAWRNKYFSQKSEQQGWISVEEELPDTWDDVIVYGEKTYDGKTHRGVFKDNLMDNGKFVLGDNVTHWMPMPKAPYIPDKSNDKEFLPF